MGNFWGGGKTSDLNNDANFVAKDGEGGITLTGQQKGGHPLKGYSSGNISTAVAANNSLLTATIPLPPGCSVGLQTALFRFVSTTSQEINIVVNGWTCKHYVIGSPYEQELAISGPYAGTCVASIRPLSAAITVKYWNINALFF